jgi:NhaA family Na+:H+ antiporter
MQYQFEKIKHYATSPDKIVQQLVRPFRTFFGNEASSSILLIGATLLAVAWTNSPFGYTYHRFWETSLSFSVGDASITRTLRQWIDEGLMAVFFFAMGLEIKREILVGELSSLKKALLPVGAALGGMLLPAVIYSLINKGLPTSTGWGIPMATDIAFALGALFILGKRIPLGLRVFLAALAIADDLGSVIVIALFYSSGISLHYLFISFLFLLLIAVANLLWIRVPLIYAILGVGLWVTVLGSGLHATIAGVVVALFIPAKGRYDTDTFLQNVSKHMSAFSCPPDGCGPSILKDERHLSSVHSIELACHHVETPLQRLEHALHPWVAFLVVPLFALANMGLTIIAPDLSQTLRSPMTFGIAAGLLFGKPIGISAFSYLFVRAGFASLPRGVSWPQIFGVSVLGGIGFTMSLFISGLSFKDPLLLDHAKLGILTGSTVSGMIGLVMLFYLTPKRKSIQSDDEDAVG